jgi:hypothetical protein
MFPNQLNKYACNKKNRSLVNNTKINNFTYDSRIVLKSTLRVLWIMLQNPQIFSTKIRGSKKKRLYEKGFKFNIIKIKVS